MAECCGGRCRRKQAILVRQGGLSGRWYAVTRYKRVDDTIVEAQEKHDITDDLVATLVGAGWTPPEAGGGQSSE